MLLRPLGSGGRDLLLLTFLDLVYWDVLTLQSGYRVDHDGREHPISWVTRGSMFANMKAQPFQRVFLDQFPERETERMLPDLIRNSMIKSGGFLPYKRRALARSLKEFGWLRQFQPLSRANVYWTNAEGKILRRKLKIWHDKANRL
ncbi:MAG: hypothetical protein AAFQ98_26905, partial [Bacteroidota bacterium]